VGWDPNIRCLRDALFPEDFTLAERLAGWLEGHEGFPTAPPLTNCRECLEE